MMIPVNEMVYVLIAVRQGYKAIESFRVTIQFYYSGRMKVPDFVSSLS